MKSPEPSLHSVDIGDSAIQYLLYDSGGPPLVLLHATGFLPWLWHPIARELADAYTVYAPYFCDHREADPHAGGLRWPVLAADMVAFCSLLGLDRVRFMGHSMGATIITLAAARLGLPAAAMVLIEPIYLPDAVYTMKLTVRDHPLASKSIKRRNFWNDANEARAYLKSKKLFVQWDDEILDLYVRHGFALANNGGFKLVCSPEREASLFMGSVHENPWPLLPEVRCPVLVMEGELSDDRPLIDLKKATALFPQGRYCMVAGAGHLVPMERPREVLALAREFFNNVLTLPPDQV